MATKDLVLPLEVSQGITWEARFNETVVIEGGGDEQRNQLWELPRRRGDLAMALETPVKRDAWIAFQRVLRGMHYSFKARDHTDYKVTQAQGVVEDLGGDTYQLLKRYTVDSETFDEDVTLPEQGSLTVYDDADVALVEGVGYSVDYMTGIVTALGGVPPIIGSWAGRYYVRVRFDLDGIPITARTVNFARLPSIPLIEVRLEEEAA